MAEDDFETEGRLVETVTRRNANPNIALGAAAIGAAVLFLGVMAYTSSRGKTKPLAESSETFNTARLTANLDFEKPASKADNRLVLRPPAAAAPPAAQAALIVPPQQSILDDGAARAAAETERLQKEEEAKRLARLRSNMLVVDSKDGVVAGSSVSHETVRITHEEEDANRTFMQNVGAQDVEVARALKHNRIDALIPQGTMIRGVIETAVQSDLPGMVRAITTEDVYSFDGRRILVPKGTMLTGEYRSAVARGQTRVFIVWTRLLRADGVSLLLARISHGASASIESVARLAGHIAADARHRCAENALAAD